MSDQMEPCPICSSQAEISTSVGKHSSAISCIRCGKFKLTETAIPAVARQVIPENKKYAISHWIRKKQNNKEQIIIDSRILKILINECELPRLGEQINNLIRWLGDNILYPEVIKKVNTPLTLATTIGAKDHNGLKYVAESLKENDYLSNLKTGYNENSPMNFQLSVKGWEKYEELKRSGSFGEYAFMAMQYGEVEHDKIYQKFFKPAVKQTGFDLRRLDEALAAGLIDNQLRVEIKNCRFLLADLTNDNNGAYWEAGYAEGLGKPVIYLCEKKKFDKFKTHFDTNHHTTVIWDQNNLKKATEILKATIRATLPTETKMTDE
jgi:hypothetical protein